jgi:hypothetical protein
MFEFVAILIGLALLWQLRRTGFGKAMFVLLGLCVLSLAIMTGAEIIKTTWKQPAPAFDPDEYLRNTPAKQPNPFDRFDRVPAAPVGKKLLSNADLGLPPPPEPAPMCLDDACLQAPWPGKLLTDAKVRLPSPVDPTPPLWQVEPTGEEQRLRQAQAEREKSGREAQELERTRQGWQAAQQEWQAAFETRRRQDAQADFERRRQAASQKIEVVTTNIECRLNLSCGLFTLTVRIRNQSSETIKSLSIGWAFMAAADDLLCPNSLPTKHKERINLNPGDTTVLNIDGTDGPTSKRFRYCVNATGVELQ